MAYKGSVDNGAFKAQGVQLTAKLGYPITDDLDIYTRLGGMVWRADSKGNYASTGVSRSEHDTGVSPVFAGGVEWAVTRDIATRLEYQWVNNIGDAGTVGTRPDNGMLSPAFPTASVRKMLHRLLLRLRLRLRKWLPSTSP